MLSSNMHATCTTAGQSRTAWPASCRQLSLGTLQNRVQPMCFRRQSAGRRHRRRFLCSAVTDLPLLESEDSFKSAISSSSVVVVDWMARWCRKCIYLKPKITKLFENEFPDIPLCFLDVNAVPGKLVYSSGIRKMPTIVVYKDGEKVAEHIAAEGGPDAVDKVRAMVQQHIGTPQPSH